MENHTLNVNLALILRKLRNEQEEEEEEEEEDKKGPI